MIRWQPSELYHLHIGSGSGVCSAATQETECQHELNSRYDLHIHTIYVSSATGDLLLLCLASEVESRQSSSLLHLYLKAFGTFVAEHPLASYSVWLPLNKAKTT